MGLTAEERARMLKKKYGTISYGGGAGGAGESQPSGYGKFLWPALGIGAGALGAYGLYHGIKGLGLLNPMQAYAKENLPEGMYNALAAVGNSVADTSDYIQENVLPTVGTVMRRTGEQIGPAIANTARAAGNRVQQAFAPIANPPQVTGPDGQPQTNQPSFGERVGQVANAVGGLYNQGRNAVNSTVNFVKDTYNTMTGGQPTENPTPGQVNAQVVPNAQTNAPATPPETLPVQNPTPAQRVIPKAYGGQVPRYASGSWAPGYMGRMMKANNYAIPKEASAALASAGAIAGGHYVNKRGGLLNQILGKGAIGLGAVGGGLNMIDLITQIRNQVKMEQKYADLAGADYSAGANEELTPDEFAQRLVDMERNSRQASQAEPEVPTALTEGTSTGTPLEVLEELSDSANQVTPEAYGGQVPRYADGFFSRLAGRTFKALGNYFSPDPSSDTQTQPQTQQSAQVNQAPGSPWPSQNNTSSYSQTPQPGPSQAFKRSGDGQQGLAAHSQYQGNVGGGSPTPNNNMSTAPQTGQPYKPTMLDQGLNAASYITGHPTLAPVVGGALRGIADVMAPQGGGNTPAAPVANSSTNIPVGGNVPAQTAPALNPANNGFFRQAGQAIGTAASIPAFMSPFGLLAGGIMGKAGLPNPIGNIGGYLGGKIDDSGWGDTLKGYASDAWNGIKNWWNQPQSVRTAGSLNPGQPELTNNPANAYGGQVPRYDSGGWPDRQYRKTSRAMVGALGGGALGVLGGNLYGYKDLREKLANNYDYYDKQALQRRGGEWFTPMSTMAPIGALLGGGLGYNS